MKFFKGQLFVYGDDKKRWDGYLVFGQEYDKEKFEKENKKGHGIFITIQSFKNDRRISENLIAINAIAIDIDFRKEGEAEIPKQKLDNKKQEALNSMGVEELHPSQVVYSKNGFHAYWFLKEPIQITDDNRNGWISRYNALARAMIEWSKGFGSQGDKTSDVTRVLRVPGFYHHKVEPFLIPPAKILKDVTYSIEELETKFQGQIISTDNFVKVDSHDWKGLLKGKPEGKRNETAVTVIGKFLYHLPPGEWQEVAWPMLEAWNKNCEPPLDEKSLIAAFKSIAEKERARRVTEEKKETEELIKIENSKLESIKTEEGIGWSNFKIIQGSRFGKTINLETSGGIMQISVSDIAYQQLFKLRIMENFGIVIDKVKNKIYDLWVKKWFENIKEVETNDLMVSEMIKEALEEFSYRAEEYNETNLEAMTERGITVKFENGFLFKAPKFSAWFQKIKGVKITEQKMYFLLNNVGCIRKKIGKRDKEQDRRRRVWFYPLEENNELI